MLFYIATIQASLRPVIFGDNAEQLDLVWACKKHWGQLRWKHGTELGYTMRNGKIHRYVKETYM